MVIPDMLGASTEQARRKRYFLEPTFQAVSNI